MYICDWDKEGGVSRVNPRKHSENLLTPHRKTLARSEPSYVLAVRQPLHQHATGGGWGIQWPRRNLSAILDFETSNQIHLMRILGDKHTVSYFYRTNPPQILTLPFTPFYFASGNIALDKVLNVRYSTVNIRKPQIEQSSFFQSCLTEWFCKDANNRSHYKTLPTREVFPLFFMPLLSLVHFLLFSVPALKSAVCLVE